MSVRERRVIYRLAKNGDVRLIDLENESLGSIPEVYVRETIHALVRHQIRRHKPHTDISESVTHISELIDALIMRCIMEIGG